MSFTIKNKLTIHTSAKAIPRPKLLVSATGGTVVTSGDYKIHTFTSNGTFTITNGGNIEVLVVGGGGGGGHTHRAAVAVAQ